MATRFRSIEGIGQNQVFGDTLEKKRSFHYQEMSDKVLAGYGYELNRPARHYEPMEVLVNLVKVMS